MHYKVHKRCVVKGVTYMPDQTILEGDMPRSELLPAIIAKDIEQVGEIDKSPYVEPPPPVVPDPSPDRPVDVEPVPPPAPEQPSEQMPEQPPPANP